MRRVTMVATGFDVPLRLEEGDIGAPGPDEVVVAVEACGVCHRDLIDRAGRIPFLVLPRVPGHEACGRVVALGEAVDGLRIGDRVATMHRDACGRCDACARGETSLCPYAARVFGLTVDGGYASHVVAPESSLYRLPDDLPAAAGAVLHCTFGTAWRGLNRHGGLRAGQRVLVAGAHGGVGAAAVQLARRAGATVIGVVRRPEQVDAVVGWGAHDVLVDDGATFHKRLPGGPVDVALDCVGQPTFHAAARSLRIGGGITVVGNVVDARVELNLGWLITSGVTVVGSSGATRRDMAEVLALHAERPLTFAVEAVPLADAEAAQQRLRAGGVAGRLALVP
jgi:D-arabinose 1-dehydrogenase-like Zn-dependent alcohol dehydrogenase